MHYKKVKGILSSENGMNLYRGCQHGCIYCDSRSRCYNMDHAFEDIEVKENAVELLEDALKRKRKKSRQHRPGHMIAILFNCQTTEPGRKRAVTEEIHLRQS